LSVEASSGPSRPDIAPQELTREKDLFSLYKLSFKFPGSKFNRVVTLMTAAALVTLVWLTRTNVDNLSVSVRAVFAFGNATVPSILGFLVAGFTIFVTVTKAEIFVYMAKRPYRDTGESFLKYNLTAFVLAFTHYLGYLFCLVIVVLFGQPNSPLITLVKRLFAPYIVGDTPAYNLLLGGVFVAFGTWTIYLVLLLKSFVYNTYQVVTTTVRWQLMQAGENTADKTSVV
jgi:hypothetical protein